jgi:trk system potassium uptake protein TrkH
MVAGRPEGFAFLDAVQHIVLAVAMILGRIETLAVIALFNADYWRAGPERRTKTGKTSY